MVKKTKKVKKVSKEKAPKKGLHSVYENLMDNIEKEFGLSSSDLVSHKISSGLASVDLVLGGGYGSGFHVISGQEQSGKSTEAAHLLKESLKHDIPIRRLEDAEGTVDPRYTNHIFGVKRLSDIFGIRDKKGNWIQPAKIRYSDKNVIEDVFNSLIKTVNRLPDKVYRSDHDQWYFVLEPNDKRTTTFASELGSFDKQLKSKTGNLWFPTDNPWPQAVIVIDSLPAMITESIDEKEENSRGMALMARAFSENLPRLVGKLRSKNVVIFAVNQIREKPGVMFGSPFYEPGGNAIKFYSRSRNQIFARAVPQEWRSNGSTSQYSVEKSLLGDGVDEYAFKHLRNVKNKMGSPYLDCWTRVWIKDHKGLGRGFDPVFDTWIALQHAGYATESKSKGVRSLQFDQDLPKSLDDLSKKQVSWPEFKALILGHEPLAPREVKDLCYKAEKARKVSSKSIRNRLMHLINNGQAQYNPIAKSKESKE